MTAPGPSSASDSALAAEEARFLRRLYDCNAPANEIAGLLRAMGTREEVNSGMVVSSRHAANAEPEVVLDNAPPAYDFRLDGLG